MSFDYPRTPEQEAIDEGIRLQNERLQEQLNQVRVNTPEFIGNAWSVGGVKVKPIDRLYPHQCQREYVDKKGNKKKCPRNLKFEELLLAEANKKLKASFIDKVFGYLTEHYSQFSYDVRAEWSDIFGKFEYRQYLRKLWKNPRVQFYCCACFRKATLTDVHDAFDTTERDFVNQLQEDLLEGTGLTREQLLGSEENDQIQEWIDGVHPINRQAVAENPNIMVYSFTRGYNCPNCLRRLQLNEFHNWECSHCHEQSLRGTGLSREELLGGERNDFLLFCMRYGIDIQLEQFRQCNERFRMEYCYSHTLNEYPSRESDYLKRRRHDSIYTQYLEHSRGLR